MMADYGHDPTGTGANRLSSSQVPFRFKVTDCVSETAVPYSSFREAGFDVSFATEKGVSPRCDERMLQGITRHLFVRNRVIFSFKTLITCLQGNSTVCVKEACIHDCF